MTARVAAAIPANPTSRGVAVRSSAAFPVDVPVTAVPAESVESAPMEREFSFLIPDKDAVFDEIDRVQDG